MVKQADWQLLGLWTVVPPLVGTLSLAVPISLISRLDSDSFVGDNGLGPLYILAFCLVAISAPIIGLAQGLILKRWLTGTTQYLAGNWVMVTVAGVLLGIVTAVVVNASFLWQGGTVLLGFVLGWMQWLLLKGFFQKASRWIPTCGVAWMASVIVVLLLNLVFPSLFDLSALPYFSPGTLLYMGIVSLAGLLIFSAITGLLLLNLVASENFAQIPEPEPH